MLMRMNLEDQEVTLEYCEVLCNNQCHIRQLFNLSPYLGLNYLLKFTR